MKRVNFFQYIALVFLFSCNSISHTGKTRDRAWATKVENGYLNNLYKINDSVYRSEQPGREGFNFINTLGIKSVLNLRNRHSDAALLNNKELTGYHIKIETKDFSDSEIIESLKIIKTAYKPILIHCRFGSDRTGVVSAMYRIVFENWTKEKALDELKNGNYGFHKQFKNIPGYIMNVNTDSIKKAVLSEN
jgi:protein tyrosine/serine phosphatase